MNSILEYATFLKMNFFLDIFQIFESFRGLLLQNTSLYAVFVVIVNRLGTVLLKAHSTVWYNFGNWKPFKNDPKYYLFHVKKLFSFSRYLSFCHDFLAM